MIYSTIWRVFDKTLTVIVKEKEGVKMKKRILSLLLSTAMIVSLLPVGSMTALAAGTSSDGLVAAESVKADVDKTKFTHKEWTGTD